MDNNQNNVVKPSKREFGLESEPQAYIISVHIRNMMATYGEQYVRETISELFLKQQPKRRSRKNAANE